MKNKTNKPEVSQTPAARFSIFKSINSSHKTPKNHQYHTNNPDTKINKLTDQNIPPGPDIKKYSKNKIK